MRRISILKILAGIVLIVIFVIGGLTQYLHSPEGATALAGMISRSASSPGMKVEVGAVEDVLSSHPLVRNVTISDRDGPWLKIDRVDAHWSRLALLALRLDIDKIDIGKIDVLRRPVLSSAPPVKEPPKAAEKSNDSLKPNLPIRIRLGNLALSQLALAEPVLEQAITLSVNAAADVGSSSDDAKAQFSMLRTDAPGTVSTSAQFDPRDNKLKIKLAASEPEGGMIARLAQIPGLPPVEIDLDGAGTLDAFDAKLTAKAGNAIAANGGATITREGAARKIALDLTARIAELLPKSLAALFNDATKVEANAHLGDDGATTLDQFVLKTSAFALDATGKLDAKQNISGRASLHGVSAGKDAAFSAKTLEGEATVTGSVARPDAALKFLIEDADGPMGKLGHIDLDAKATADGDLSNPASRIDVSAQGHASDLVLADAALAEALGETAGLSLRARASGAGDADVGLAKIETGAGEASFSGRAGPSALDGRATVSVPDLHRFARLAKRDLRGALTLGADLSGAPEDGRIEAKLNGAVVAPSAGTAAIDRLLGRRLTLAGKVATLPGGGLAFDKLDIHGDNLAVNVDGQATKDEAKIDAKLAVPDLHQADPRLSGRADATAGVTGSLDKPDAALDATIRDASVNGRSIPKLALHGEAHDLVGDLTARATLDGTVDNKPARGRVTAARAGKGWTLDDVDLAVGRATLKGAAALDGAGLASGRLTLAAPDLDDFSAFALQTLGGRLNADVTFAAANGGQNVAIDAQGAGIRAQNASIERLNAKFSARDALRRPMLDGEIAVDDVHVGKEVISRARLDAKPVGAGAAALDLSLAARGFNVASRATLTPGERTRLDIAQFSADRAGKKIALAQPATVTLYKGAVDLKGLSVALGSGRLDVDGTAGERLDLTAKARAVPLSVAQLADPSLALDGVLDAEARITGPKSAPSGDWKVKVAKASAPQLKANGLPAVDASASGRLSGQRTSVDANIALGSTSNVKIAGSAPLGEGSLDLAIKGVIDAALANAMLSANGQTAAGKANIDLRLTGSAGSPIVGGNVMIADGAFNDPINGVALSKITGRIEGHGRDLNIAQLTAQTKNGGSLSIGGKVTVAPDAGMPGSIHIGGQNAQLVNSDVVSSTADLDLMLAGALARAPKVSGKVTLRTMDVNVPDRIPANLKPLPGSHHIDAKGFAAQMLALECKEKARAAKQRSTFDATLDLALSAPSKIFVRGRGIDAEFGGDLKILGSAQKPKIDGGFELRRGTLQLLTQRIDITHGVLTFAGGLTPELDFTAQTQASDVTATIAVAGPAALPTFTFSSTPELPQDEVLSRLLFAKASGELTPFQAVQLATAIAQLSGAGSGNGAFDKMRKSLGVDTLDLDAGGSSGPSVGASRYIMDGVNVGVKTGSKPEQSAVDVGVDVTKRMRVKSETRKDGKTSVGVGVEWEY